MSHEALVGQHDLLLHDLPAAGLRPVVGGREQARPHRHHWQQEAAGERQAGLQGEQQEETEADDGELLDGAQQGVLEGRLDCPGAAGGEVCQQPRLPGLVIADRQLLEVREDPDPEVVADRRGHPGGQPALHRSGAHVEQRQEGDHRQRVGGDHRVAGRQGPVDQRPQEQRHPGRHQHARRQCGDAEQEPAQVWKQEPGQRAQESPHPPGRGSRDRRD